MHHSPLSLAVLGFFGQVVFSDYSAIWNTIKLQSKTAPRELKWAFEKASSFSTSVIASFSTRQFEKHPLLFCQWTHGEFSLRAALASAHCPSRLSRNGFVSLLRAARTCWDGEWRLINIIPYTRGGTDKMWMSLAPPTAEQRLYGRGFVKIDSTPLPYLWDVFVRR